MNCELTFYVGNTLHHAFLQNGFFSFCDFSSTVHCHQYGEMHGQIDGTSLLEIQGRRYYLNSGDLLFIPAGKNHRISERSAGSRAFAFQTDWAIPAPGIASVSADMLLRLSEAITAGKSRLTGAYLSVLCAAFLPETSGFRPLADRGFIIHEFFEHRYSEDITLSMLAKELTVSEKQAGRLVKQYCGMTFREMLTAQRLQKARLLSDCMSLSHAGLQAGFKSYSGFWKAVKKEKSTDA